MVSASAARKSADNRFGDALVLSLLAMRSEYAGKEREQRDTGLTYPHLTLFLR